MGCRGFFKSAELAGGKCVIDVEPGLNCLVKFAYSRSYVLRHLVLGRNGGDDDRAVAQTKVSKRVKPSRSRLRWMHWTTGRRHA